MSITGAVAGTWQELQEPTECISNFANGDSGDYTIPDGENPEYKTPKPRSSSLSITAPLRGWPTLTERSGT